MTTAVSRERREAQLWSFSSPSYSPHRAHRRGRSSGVAVRARTARAPSFSSTVASGRLEVQPPGRLRIAPAVHRHGDEIGPILVVAENDVTLLARATPDRLQSHHPPRLGRNWAQPNPATRQRVERAVDCPGAPHDPPRRERRGTSLVGTWLAGHRARDSFSDVVNLGQRRTCGQLRVIGVTSPRRPAQRAASRRVNAQARRRCPRGRVAAWPRAGARHARSNRLCPAS